MSPAAPALGRVLCATDLREFGNRAVPYAFHLAAPGGRVTLVTVLVTRAVPSPLVPRYGEKRESDDELDAKEREASEALLALGRAAAAGRGAAGMKVQPFKVGPDFIDPSHHTQICGRPSRNLDPFIMGERGCIKTFLRATEGSDIAVIDGVMGMYDGVDGSDLASTAHVARILEAPVVLVVDAKGMSRSVHALIEGYRRYDPSICFAGVIFNRIGSPRHRTMIETSLDIPSFGMIPRKEDLAVKSRHLGHMMAHESGAMADFGNIIEEHADLDALISSAACAPPLKERKPTNDTTQFIRTSVGIALDDAFCFYYQDNLDLLQRAGAELVFFSPLTDPLPEVDSVYLGGGYPELFLHELEANDRMREAVRECSREGVPVYAECGGLMYLTEE